MLDKSRNSPVPDDFFNTLKEFLHKKAMLAGLSLSSRSPIETHILFSQARDAVFHGRKSSPGQALYFFADYALDAFFEECVDKINSSYYLHPSLRLLQEYDARHKTCLSDTLRVYLLMRSCQIKTAEKLSIHRSTLLYRLNKIAEITRLDLSDCKTLFHLQLSFGFLEHMP